MIPVEELRRQNDDIEETCRVLKVLLTDASVCDTRICHEIFDRFVAQVKAHLELEDRSMYSELLVHPSRKANQVATRFLDSSYELKRLFSHYLDHWTRPGAKHADRERFVGETEEMVRLLLERLQVENRDMFPLVQELQMAA